MKSMSKPQGPTSRPEQARGNADLDAPSMDSTDALVSLSEFLTDACRFYHAARTRFEPGGGSRYSSPALTKMRERLRVRLPQAKELLRDQDHTTAHLSGLNLDTRRLAAIVEGVEKMCYGWTWSTQPPIRIGELEAVTNAVQIALASDRPRRGNDELITGAVVHNDYGFHASTLWRLRKKGDIKSYRPEGSKGKHLYRRSEIEALRPKLP